VPRPRTHDDDLRVALIETAAKLLADEGPHAISTRRVAREVGTSTTAIYSLLGSKNELVRAMYLEGFGRLAAAQDAVVRTDDPVRDLCALAWAYFENGVANPYLYEVMFHRPVREFTPAPDDVAFAHSTLQDVVVLAQRCIDAGEFVADVDADDLAVELWAVVHGVTSLVIAGMLDERAAHARLEHLLHVVTTGNRSHAPNLQR
jgi:AcrR family transcriptional regulator